jgi:RimJ/RimL family protein N-acetyltransferase
MIRGTKVDLVAVSTEYIDKYGKWINDPEVTDKLGDPKIPLSKGKEREWLESVLSGQGDGHVFTILTKKGEPIGNISFNHLDFRNSHGVLGIMIGEKRLWDKGFGTDAIKTLLRFGFEELGLRKIELFLDPGNKRALACYKNCGFVEEGRARKHIFHRGEYIDDLRMGILREEWLRLVKKK